MICELSKEDFHKCKSIINGAGQLEVKAIVEGINPGRIFVDHLISPTTGLVWLGNNDGFVFIGNEHNDAFNYEINGFLDLVIAPEARKVGLEWFEGLGNHQGWDTVIEKLFTSRNLKSWNQKVYTLSKTTYKEKSYSMEKGYTVTKISSELLKDSSIKNMDFLRLKVSEFWTSSESFLNTGKGYCVLFNNMIVSICLSGFVVENIHCIAIETFKGHRGRKLGQVVAYYFVKDCLENGNIPYWDCMEENWPSVAIAENLGFENVFDYKGYYFKLKD